MKQQLSVCSLLLLYKAKKQNLPHAGKKRIKNFRFKWSSEAMWLAITDIQQSKLSKKKAAAYYGVPKTNYFQFQLGLFWLGKIRLMKNSSLQ